jgi:pimeloyl-ACP methyl ester carboxylesterase
MPSRETVVLLHPGGTDSSAMAVTAAGLEDRFDVRVPDRRHEAFPAMAQATVAFLEAETDAPVHLVGHSDGAIVGLLVARARPDLVRRLVFSSGVHHHSGWLPGVELEERHHTEPALMPAELAAIATPTLVMAADEDEMPLEHTIALYRALPDADLAIVPGTDHGSLADKPDLCNAMIADFLGAPR